MARAHKRSNREARKPKQESLFGNQIECAVINAQAKAKD